MKKTDQKVSEDLLITCNFDLFDENRYSFICKQVDIFDHWPTEEELNARAISYPVLLSNKQDLTEYFIKEKELVDFLGTIFDNHKIILCRDGEHFEFDTKDEFKGVCIRSIREEELATFHVPELDLTVYGNYDMNLPFNFSSSSKAIAIIEGYIRDFPNIFLLG